MGKTRVCGKRCHNARRSTCRCWCGGVFHGNAGREAREKFCATFKVEIVPTTEAVFREVTGQLELYTEIHLGENWRAAVTAARAASA